MQSNATKDTGRKTAGSHTKESHCGDAADAEDSRAESAIKHRGAPTGDNAKARQGENDSNVANSTQGAERKKTPHPKETVQKTLSEKKPKAHAATKETPIGRPAPPAKTRTRPAIADPSTGDEIPTDTPVE